MRTTHKTKIMKANLNKSKLLGKMNTIYFTETQTLAANL